MKRLIQIFATLMCGLVYCASAEAQMSTRPQVAAAPKVNIDLIAESRTVQPGQPFWIGLRQRIRPNWHTYWKNPGDSGEPTHIKWDLPEGYKASEIHWPIPDVIPVGSLVNYGFSDEVILLSKITPPADVLEGPIDISAKARWLVCEKICIPESGQASLRLNGVLTPENSVPSDTAKLVDEARRALPHASPWNTIVEVANDKLKLRIDNANFNTDHVKAVRFFPAKWGQVSNSAEQKIDWQGGSPSLVLTRGELKDEKLDQLRGLLVIEEKLQGRDVRHGFNIDAPAEQVANIGTPSSQMGIGLWQALLFAFLGGAILNLMPCVFPVLSLKAVTLARHGEGEMAERKNHGLAYLAGVLVSFFLFGLILLALRAAGQSMGWGFQFQSPLFVLAMAALFFALGLSLSGVFSIGGNLIGVGQSLTEKNGRVGSFFTGALASLAATPCTAPFMGVAMGYAFTQPAFSTLAIFLALGLGFAAPVTALSFSTTLARLLPKPGPWMETFKQVLAFPLYASAAWLVWVLSVQAGSTGVLAAAIVLVSVGLVAWLFGAHERASNIARLASIAILLFAGVTGFQLLSNAQPSQQNVQTAVNADSLSEPFSRAKLEKYLNDGRTVFVNLTAAWCITCKVNELVALSSEGFRKALDDNDIVYLKGDWTNRDEEITALLKAHGRAGVPLYLLFRGKDGAPHVFPQLLTEAMVVKHLAKGSESAQTTIKSNGE